MLGIKLIIATYVKLNVVHVVIPDENLILLNALTHAYWTVVLDVGDWGLWGDLCCRVAARVLPRASRASLCTYPLVNQLVCRVFLRRMMNTQHWSRAESSRTPKRILEQW